MTIADRLRDVAKWPPYLIPVRIAGADDSLLRWAIYGTIAASPVAVAGVLAATGILDWSAFSRYWVRLNFSFVIFFAFVFMDLIHERTQTARRAFDYLAGTRVGSSNQDVVGRAYYRFFESRWQLLVYALMLVLGTVTGVVLDMQLHGLTYAYIVFWAAVTMFIAASGFWYTLMLWRFADGLGRLDVRDARISPVAPRETIGIMEFGRLSSTWAVFFVVEASLIYAGLFFAPWVKAGALATAVKTFWLGFIVITATLNWLIPTLAVNRLLTEAKIVKAEELQARIDLLWQEVKRGARNTHQHVDDIERLCRLLRDVRHEPTWDFNVNTLAKFGASAIPPLVIYLKENPRIVEHVTSLLR